MSTIDQAFVQAFARRNRNVSQTPPQAPSRDDGIRVDPSVSGSTQTWIDPAENTVHRADQATSVPAPQSDTTSTPATPSVPPQVNQQVNQHVNQHGHTAYAYAPRSQQLMPPVATPSIAPPTASAPPAAASPVAPIYPNAHQHTAYQHTAYQAPVQNTQQRFDQPTTDVPQAHWKRSDAPDSQNDLNQASNAAELHPIWEVDAFDIPSSVADLFFEEKLFELVAKRIHDAVNDGLQSLIVTSTKAGEGRSTIAIGMAMAAAASGLNVALVDGDIEDPTLADDLRLDLEFGWVEAARGGLPLSQIAIYSIEDSVTLVPMMPRSGNTTGASIDEVQALINELDNQFDLVIIDGPSGDMPLIEQYAAMVDSGIIAWDKSRTDLNTINELSSRMQQAGISGVGIVENFS